MENNSKRPTLILAVGMFTLLAVGFLFFVYVGNNGRKAESFASRINFHSFASRSSAYYGDLKNTGAAFKHKADSFMSSFWEEPAGTASAARDAEEAKREAGDQEWSASDNGGEGDSFGKYYKKNYGGNSGSDPSSWVDNSEGGPSFGGGASGEGSSGQYAASPKGAPRAKQQRAAAAPAFAAASGRPGADLRPGFGGPSAGSPKTAAPRLFAGLPAKNGGQSAALQYGGGMPAAGGKANNKLNGMAGDQAKGAGDLNGATEKMSGGAQSSYNSKLSGGAASVAGGSGGSVPAASAPANISGGGSSAGGKPAGSSSGPGASVDMTGSGIGALYDAPDEDTDLLKSVVSETQNGRENKYLSADDAKAAPDETMLKSGAVAGADSKVAAVTPDPKVLTELSTERKLELKKNIHVFLKRIQNRFGAMADIKTTSCADTLDLCDAHGVTGDYLTMKTQKGYKLDLGVKYIKTQWRRYTIDFEKPGTVAPKY